MRFNCLFIFHFEVFLSKSFSRLNADDRKMTLSSIFSKMFKIVLTLGTKPGKNEDEAGKKEDEIFFEFRFPFLHYSLKRRFFQFMNEEIKVIIIEDEEMWMKNLTTSLDCFGYNVTGTADNFESAVKLLNSEDYDIVLLDINLHNRNSGIELGNLIRKCYNKPYIFITASSDSHALNEAINAGASAYLSKPVTPSSLIATLQIAINNFSTNHSLADNMPNPGADVFFVKHGSKYKKLRWEDIVYLRSEKNYTILFNSTDKTEYYSRSSMSKTLNFIIPSFLKSSFIQVNRSEAVHIPFIQELSGEEIRTAYKTLTLSEAFSPGLKKAINLIL